MTDLLPDTTLADTLIPGQLIRVKLGKSVHVMRILDIDLANSMLWAERKTGSPRRVAVSWAMIEQVHDFLNSHESEPEWVDFHVEPVGEADGEHSGNIREARDERG